MSFPKYEHYKHSGVEWLGEAPAHWSVQRYKQIFIERNEKSKTGEETLLSVSAYTGVSPRAQIIEEGDHLSRAESLEGYKICHPNDLVMNIMLAWNRGLGFSAFYGIVSPAYSVFVPKPGNSPRFLDYMVRSDQVNIYYKAFSSGVIDSRLRLYPDTFGALYCVLPSKEEQATIAAFLDRETTKLDALITEQRTLIDLLKEKRQAVISYAVTKGLDPRVPMKDSGVEWLGAVPAHWDIVPAKRVSSIFVPQRNKPELNTDGDGFFWVTMEQMRNDVISASELFVSESAVNDAAIRVLPAGAVVASCVGTFGLAAINVVDVVINQQLQAFVPTEDIDPKFLRYCVLIAEGYFNQIGTSATIAYVNQLGFANMPLPLPTRGEQQQIAERLASESIRIDLLISEAVSTVALLTERRSALISAAVTGKIDVRQAP